MSPDYVFRMRKMPTALFTVFIASVSVGSALAHHSLASFDTTKPVRVKGTILQFNRINPHTFLYLEEKLADGQIRRWAVEGPTMNLLARTAFPVDELKTGVGVEVCGYAPKENTIWQIVNPNGTGASMSGRLLNGEMLIMPDGQVHSWGDYGTHLCFPPDYRDQHSR